MPNPPVELHVVSDATGETAARLVQALEAQFPDQDFVEIRHPRVESEDDLQLAVNRMRGRPAVVVYTLVQPELREVMRTLCRRARLHYCDLLGQPIDAVARVSGQAAKMTPGSRRSTRSSSRPRGSTAASAAPSSTSPSCRSRRRPTGSSASSRSAPATQRHRRRGERRVKAGRPETKTEDPAQTVGALVGCPA